MTLLFYSPYHVHSPLPHKVKALLPAFQRLHARRLRPARVEPPKYRSQPCPRAHFRRAHLHQPADLELAPKSLRQHALQFVESVQGCLLITPPLLCNSCTCESASSPLVFFTTTKQQAFWQKAPSTRFSPHLQSFTTPTESACAAPGKSVPFRPAAAPTRTSARERSSSPPAAR